MATKLLKPITRETIKATDRKGNAIMVTLLPGDLIEFKSKGSRKRYQVWLPHCLNLAMLLDADRHYQDAMKEYKQKKAAGYKRLRVPKKSQFPLADFYYKATKTNP
jgi:hypothetical protein